MTGRAEDDTPSVMGRRELNKLEKLRRIVAAARALFHEKGFELTTTQEVARRAQVGAGTLFLYASTKEDLVIMAFVDEMAEVTRQSYAGLDKTTPFADQIATFFDGVLSYHTGDVRLTKYLLREVAVLRNADMVEHVRQLPIRTLLTAIVEHGQETGEVRDDLNAKDIAALLFAVYWDCLRDWVNGALPEDEFRGRLHNMVTLQMDGVGAGRTRRPPRGRQTRLRQGRLGKHPPARRKLKETILF